MYRPITRLTSACLGLIFLLSACDSSPPATAFAVTAPPVQSAAIIATQEPPTPLPPTDTPTATDTPTLTVTPSSSPTATATATPTLTPTPARVAFFAFARPIGGRGVTDPDRTYPYGSTAQGNWPVHHGVEFFNPRGTPVIAAGDGVVYYAGDDSERLFGPFNGYYGNLVVIAHPITSTEGLPVYTLYAHLDRVEIETGATVREGQRLGTVGATGVAVGPHLHFEVRVGDPDRFGSARNPELWLRPYPRSGVIAGRLTDSEGKPLHEVVIQVRREGRATVARYGYTYADDPLINSDAAWGENFVVSDLSADERYEVLVSDHNGRIRFRQTVDITANDITWVEIVLGP